MKNRKVQFAAASPEHRAVIDVGTNSIKLLVANTPNGAIHPVLETSAKQPVRLGKGFYATHSLSPESIAGAVQVIGQLLSAARRFTLRSIHVIATSAMREATNAEDLVRAVRDAYGLQLEIISGDREAEWVFEGVASDPKLAGWPLLILDVGGGSTEMIASDGTKVRFRRSFKLGAVRLMERLKMGDAPTTADRSRCEDFLAQFFGDLVVPVLNASLPARSAAMRLIGSGGTAACLANIQARGKDADWLTAQAGQIKGTELRAQLDRLWNLTLTERKKIPGLPENRADVILTGAAIFEAAMTHLGFAEMSVSRRGLRFGVLMAIIRQSSQVEAQARPGPQLAGRSSRLSA